MTRRSFSTRSDAAFQSAKVLTPSLKRLEIGDGQVPALEANGARRERLDLLDGRIGERIGRAADERIEARAFLFDLRFCISAIADEQRTWLS